MAKKQRSPAYPMVALDQAIEYADAIYQQDRRSQIPVKVAVEHLGFSDGSSRGLRAIAALSQFGLVEQEGKREDRRVRLTNLALDILISSSPDHPDRLSAIRAAALEPRLHSEIWEREGGELPSNAALRANLVRHYEFNENTVDGFIREFRETIEFAGLGEEDTIPDGVDEDDEQDVVEESPNRGFKPDLFTMAMGTPSTSNASKMIELPITLPSLAVASVRVPKQMSEMDYQTLVSALTAWKAALVPKPDTPDAGTEGDKPE